MNFIPPFITEHATIWLLGLVGMLTWGGAMAYMDTRHVQRSEFIQALYTTAELRLLDKIDDADAEIERLELYNRLGSKTNQAAREQVILQMENRKAKWQRELEALKRATNDT